MKKQLKYCMAMLCLNIFFFNSAKPQPQLTFTPFIQNLNTPLEIKNAGDGSGRLFIVEQTGYIKIYKNNHLLPKPFLNISKLVSFAYLKGLYSVAFSPNYKTNRTFFLLYVNKQNNTQLARFKTSAINADSAVVNSGVVLITFPGVKFGELHFGSDGYLYLTVSDGSYLSATTKNAQDGTTLLGKMLRLNVNNINTPPYYTIPSDNPFINDSTVRHEIWAFGLRNAWRWSFDKTNGKLYLPDVGGDNWEEVNIRKPAQSPGSNYGWPCYEGNAAFITQGCRSKSNYVFPVFTYPHDSATGGYAVIGGYVYRGAAYPDLKGYYICSDHYSNNAWKIRPNGSGGYDVFMQSGIPSLIAGYGEGEDGELYAASLEGIVYRVGAIADVTKESEPEKDGIAEMNIHEFISLANDSTPANCKWNLMNPIFKNYSTISNISYAKSPFPAECKDVSYANDDAIGRCIPLDGCGSGDASLFYDVYYPLHDYRTLKLPAIILAHPGGFMECTNLRSRFMNTLCTAFVRRGFVVFNIEYRRGRVLDPTNNFSAYKTVQQEAAVYRASQDMRGALRSIIKRERLQNQPYSIDTNKIFIGGASAGGIMTMNTAWFTNAMVYASFPTQAGYPKIKELLGPIDADYYFGEPSINFNPGIKGVMILWSGMYFPYKYKTNESAFFAKATLKPVIAFHGKNDHVFPYFIDTSQDIYFSPPPKNKNDFDYNKETRCLIDTPYKLDDVAEKADLISASPLNMYSILDSLASTVPKELYLDCNMRHGLDDDGPRFNSDFGTGDTSTTQVTVYIAQRVATFFQAVMNGAVASDLNPSKFTDCENTRKGCDYSDNSKHCSNFDSCTRKETNTRLNYPNNNAVNTKRESQITLYPNPVKNSLTVNGLETSNTRVIVTDANGRVMKQARISTAAYTLDIHTLTAGVYFIKVKNSKQSLSLKFVKE